MKVPRWAWTGAAALLALGGLTFLRCGSVRCGATSCPAGCCDATGACRPGNDAHACGAGGAVCADCTTSMPACVSQACAGAPADAGSDAGSADAGPTCQHLTSFDAGSQSGFYDPDLNGSGYAVTAAIQRDATQMTQLVNEVFWTGNTIVLPLSRDWSQPAYAGFAKCDWCVFMNADCSPTTGMCSNQMFLAVGGTGTLTRADQDAGSGGFAATATGLHLVAWLYDPSTTPVTDRAVDGGACFDVDQMSVAVTWELDAGGADAGTADAGDGG